MMNENFHIKLEAKNPDKGNFRAYEIDAGPDLLGQWQIEGEIWTDRPSRAIGHLLCCG
ncbi:MAG: hypothetical protein R3B95_08200 [Nitrospirales bacterium]|nr:hypothetical protein [Nitrospirales bacterium]